MKHPFKTDVAVLMIFFNRPDKLRKVFDEVRKARPSRLFLYQDGPRSDDDMPAIAECRSIVADVDWECDVRHLYQERNYGCNPSGFLSQRWAFSMADKCVFLEDDVVPSQSFIPFCKEMLDRYEYDERVWMVAGFNSDEVTQGVPDDYFFTSVFSIWGWASWRRVFDTWDEHYTFLDDEYAMRQLRDIVRQRRLRGDFIQMCRDHRASGKAFFESIFWASMLLGSGLAVMPVRNLVNNIGVTADSTHFSGSVSTLPRRLARMFTMPRYELQFPLRHPRHVIENVSYKESVYRANAWGHPCIKVARSLEELLRNLRYGNFANIGRAIRLRVAKWTGRWHHS